MNLALERGDLDAFFQVPFECYGGTPYVSPMRSDLARMLDSRRNPYVRDGHARLEVFTVRCRGRAAGRIVAHVHRDANRRHGTNRANFGFFDCADDPAVAARLLDAAESWARDQGCDAIGGNFNLTPAQQMGVVTGGFDHAPYTDMMYNPPHIPRLLAAHGYQPEFPMTTFELDLARFDPGVLLGERQRALMADPTIDWTLLRRRRFSQVMREMRGLLNDSFAANPHFVPVSEAEFLFQAGELMWIVDERLSPVARHEGHPVCVMVCIPDLNPFLRDTGSRLGWRTPWSYLHHRRTARRAIILFGAVDPQWQNRGLGLLGLYRVTTALKEAGYQQAGITWVADVNGPSRRLMERLGAAPLHRLHLFGKALC